MVPKVAIGQEAERGRRLEDRHPWVCAVQTPLEQERSGDAGTLSKVSVFNLCTST